MSTRPSIRGNVDKHERNVILQFGGAVVFSVVFAVAVAAVWMGGLVPIAIGTPFALFMLWHALHTDDFAFDAHAEDTPYAPETVHRNSISYRQPHGAHR